LLFFISQKGIQCKEKTLLDRNLLIFFFKKQEMVISAPHHGTIASIVVKEGDSVDGQDLICKIIKAA
jgi:pyruvate carboxylase